jgi:alpha-galactosidase
MKIALIGAGSRSFGPRTLRDVFLSDAIHKQPVEVALMDIQASALDEVASYARHLNRRLERNARLAATVDLSEALDGADFVVCAIEVKRFHYWRQDFHVPRLYGFRQPFGENGGVGGIFHALRNIPPMVQIARRMERLCPRALFLNFSNPEHKTCQAVTQLTSVPAVGLCHGVFMGRQQLSWILDVPLEHLQTQACGINHFTWFQDIRDGRTGEDLYPALRRADREGNWLSKWHELGMSRILLRRFGLWPCPAANHFGEYIRWGDEFVASELQFFYDPADGHPWQTGDEPDFIYELTGRETAQPWRRPSPAPVPLEDHELKPSAELAVPIIEALACGQRRDLPAVNVPNRGAIPNLPEELVVEVPAIADAAGLRPCPMAPLPEAVAAMIRTQASIHKLIVEAYAEQSKDKLLQAVLLEPTVDSYRRAVAMVEHMLELQKDVLPPLR